MQIDLHGFYLHQLPKKLDEIIVEALIRRSEEIKIITGQGPLQKEVIQLCQSLYGYNAHVELANPGVIIVELF